MFKKNKKQQPEFVLLDINDRIIFEGKLEDIELDESIIIQKSIEFFSDANPCYIHRGAVMSRLYAEIGEILNNLELQKSIAVQAFPQSKYFKAKQINSIKKIK